MNKLTIHIYITPRAVSEVMPHGVDLVPYRHRFSHPDARMLVWKQKGLSVRGRYEEIRHAIMVTLQANGLSVIALRDYSESKKDVKSKISKKQMRLI